MALSIASVTPDTLSVHGSIGNYFDATITITGTDFATGITVEFGGIGALNVFVNSPTELICNAPAAATNADATVDVVLTLGAETAALTGGFSYYEFLFSGSTPALTQFVGGETLEVTGQGLANIDTLSLGGIELESWRWTPSDDYTLAVTVPPLATIVDGVAVPITGAIDLVGAGNGGTATLSGVITSYQQGRTLFLDGFDYYRTEDLPLKWLDVANMHVGTSGGRRGSGCLTPSAAEASLTSPIVATGTVVANGETLQVSQAVTLGVAINRQKPDAFDLDFMAGNDVAFTLRVSELGTLECIGADSASLSHVVPMGEWVFLIVTVSPGGGGPID